MEGENNQQNKVNDPVNDVIITPNVIFSDKKRNTSPFKMGGYFVAAYVVVTLLVGVIGFPIFGPLTYLISAPAGILLNTFFFNFGEYYQYISIIYIVTNAPIYFVIGCIFGKIVSSRKMETSQGMTSNYGVNNSKVTPGKLCAWMFYIALGWAIAGLVFVQPLGSLIGIWVVLGACIVGAFALLALAESISAFRGKQNTLGVQYLLLIVLLPIIGVGIGCGTCLLGVSVFDSF